MPTCRFAASAPQTWELRPQVSIVAEGRKFDARRARDRGRPAVREAPVPWPRPRHTTDRSWANQQWDGRRRVRVRRLRTNRSCGSTSKP
jgi:hypothetical protein